jgi:hypothetical protein
MGPTVNHSLAGSRSIHLLLAPTLQNNESNCGERVFIECLNLFGFNGGVSRPTFLIWSSPGLSAAHYKFKHSVPHQSHLILRS